MIVEAKFSYLADIRPKGRQKFVPVSPTSSVMVEVKELTSDDAPVAFWWRGAAAQPHFEVAARSYEGVLYEPVLLPEKAVVPGVTESSSLRMTRARIAKSRIPRFADATLVDMLTRVKGASVGKEGIVFGGLVEGEPVEKMGAAAIENSLLDSKEEEVRKFYASIKLIDGVLHRCIGVPLFFAELGYSGAIKETSEAGFFHGDPAKLFLVTEFDRAYRMFADKSIGYAKAKDFAWMRPTIVRPDLVSFDLHRHIALLAAGTVMQRLRDRHSGWNRFGTGAPHIAGLGREHKLAFAALRDHLAEDADTLTIVSDLQTMVDVLGRGGYYRNEAAMVDEMTERFIADGLIQEIAVEVKP